MKQNAPVAIVAKPELCIRNGWKMSIPLQARIRSIIFTEHRILAIVVFAHGSAMRPGRTVNV